MKYWLLLALWTLSCGNGQEANPGSVKADVHGALNVTLNGTAHFWCVHKPMKMCGLHLTPAGGDGDSINFTLTGSTRPAVGTYPLSPDFDPSARTLRANYISGQKGKMHSFVARSGEFVVTESNAKELKGRFVFDGLDVDDKAPGPGVQIQGEFVMPCRLEMRSAYTCD